MIGAITCAELDRMAHLPPEPLPPGIDVWDMYTIQARRAQIHLEMRMEIMAEEEADAANSGSDRRAPSHT